MFSKETDLPAETKEANLYNKMHKQMKIIFGNKDLKISEQRFLTIRS